MPSLRTYRVEEIDELRSLTLHELTIDEQGHGWLYRQAKTIRQFTMAIWAFYVLDPGSRGLFTIHLKFVCLMARY
jgi:hypothetical protein